MAWMTNVPNIIMSLDLIFKLGMNFPSQLLQLVDLVVFLAMRRSIKSGLGGVDRSSAIKTKVSGLSNSQLARHRPPRCRRKKSSE